MQTVQALKATFPLTLLLEIAALPRSTYFASVARAPRPAPDAALDTAIAASVQGAKRRYGHRRVHRDLQRSGWRVAKKTVLARMRALGLTCHVRRRKRWTSYRGGHGTIVPNRLNRDFRATAPNQKWVTDITEFRIGTDRLFLSSLLDLYDRQVIAYQIGPSADLSLATATLRQALATLGPTEQPLVHTDQGFQYQHASWHQLLRCAGATASMSRKGTCLDNAVIESFFGHLKSELLLEPFDSIATLQAALVAYLTWYNTDRTSAPLNGHSPQQFRAQAGAAP